jgi:mannose-6-phosphate isomerase-like protein (cupin superfamily)
MKKGKGNQMDSGLVTSMTYVPKSWGREIWVVNTNKYCGKFLHINKGMFCSFHYHKLKEETFVVLSGKVIIVYAEQSEATTIAVGNVAFDVPKSQETLYPGQAWHIKPGSVHQFYGVEDSVIFETSTEHFDSDSYRLSTDFQGVTEQWVGWDG